MMRHARVLERRVACAEAGTGDPIVFLHGNPASSYLWRRIVPQLQAWGCCLAPDLLGMGQSEGIDDSGPGSYRSHRHYLHLQALLDELDVRSRVTLVLHDWGSALGFHWTREHADRVARIDYLEAIVRPLTWDEWPAASRALFRSLRSEKGEELILERNLFIERILPGSVLRRLTDAEIAAYREPFVEAGEKRRPMPDWPRELPIDGQPADVIAIVHGYADWMAGNNLPKLFINAETGAILTGAQRDLCRTWRNQTEATVPGIHFSEEDSPDEIGAALLNWISTT
jgi:haloalkane dehalogenase